MNDQLSEPFVAERGVKQGSVLSPTLFLVVMDELLKQMRESNHGLSLCNTYAGAAIHADDLCTIAASKNTLCLQGNMITDFTNKNHLKLISSKLEILSL